MIGYILLGVLYGVPVLVCFTSIVHTFIKEGDSIKCILVRIVASLIPMLNWLFTFEILENTKPVKAIDEFFNKHRYIK